MWGKSEIQKDKERKDAGRTAAALRDRLANMSDTELIMAAVLELGMCQGIFIEGDACFDELNKRVAG